MATLVIREARRVWKKISLSQGGGKNGAQLFENGEISQQFQPTVNKDLSFVNVRERGFLFVS